MDWLILLLGALLLFWGLVRSPGTNRYRKNRSYQNPADAWGDLILIALGLALIVVGLIL